MAKAPQKRSTKRPGKDEIEAIFAAFERDNPEPKGELFATNAFTLLVAVVLSAQATDAGVNKATPALFKLADPGSPTLIQDRDGAPALYVLMPMRV